MSCLGSSLLKGSQQFSLFSSAGGALHAINQGTSSKGEGICRDGAQENILEYGQIPLLERSSEALSKAYPGAQQALLPCTYLALSVSHSWASPLCSRDRGCSSLVVVLNLQQKSTGVFQQLQAPAPGSTQCPLPQDSLVAVGELSPALGTPSLPRSVLAVSSVLGIPPQNRLSGKVLLSFGFSISALPPAFLSLPCDGVAFPKPKLSPQLPFPDT